MDARALLRRYLEQRREMGESELVLDGMSVEEVMKILGVKAVSPVGVPVRNEGPSAGSAAGPAAGPAAPALDWRSALREAGAAPTERKRAIAPVAPHPRVEKAEKGHRFEAPSGANAKPVAEPSEGMTVGPGTGAHDPATASELHR